MPPAAPQTLDRSRLVWGIVAALVLLGGAVRVWAALDDFWLDEIWSLYSVEQLDSPTGIFNQIHSDNNHYLVSLWMAVCGSRDAWIVYRIPSLAAGLGTIVLAALVARRWGQPAALVAALLTACSYVLIVYASEARGYALSGCIALGALVALERYFGSGDWRAAAAFSLLVPLGFLAHLTFGHFYFGAAVWSIARLVRNRASWREAALRLASCHAVPIATLLALYFVDLRYVVIGGGPPYEMQTVLVETLALAVGAPAAGPLAVLGALAAMSACVAGIVLLWRAGSDLWIFFAGTIFLSPLLVLSASRPEYLNLRYFYINIVFGLVLVSYVLGRLFQTGSLGRAAVASLLSLVIAGNAWQTIEFLRFGRGHYWTALQYMAGHSAGPVIHVMSDHDFRNALVLQFYSKYLPEVRDVEYYPQSAPPATPPEWIILHSEAPDYTPRPTIEDRRGTRYALGRFYPYAGLSGFHWAIYHRADLHRPRE